MDASAVNIMFSSIHPPNVLLHTGVLVTTGRTYAIVVKRQVVCRFIWL